MATAGRDPVTGRFLPGNRFGAGNRLAARAAKLRSTLLQAVTQQDFRHVVKELIRRAKEGDLAAIKVLLERTLGPPVSIDILERLEALEARIYGLQKEN